MLRRGKIQKKTTKPGVKNKNIDVFLVKKAQNAKKLALIKQIYPKKKTLLQNLPPDAHRENAPMQVKTPQKHD